MSNVELGVQTEKAFQKQPIFYNSKAARKSTRDRRWYKDVGLGFKTPRAAIEGTYIGKFSSNLFESTAVDNKRGNTAQHLEIAASAVRTYIWRIQRSVEDMATDTLDRNDTTTDN